MMRNEFAWLVEGPGACYLAVRHHNNHAEFTWTEDANEALRFYDESQAKSALEAIYELAPKLFISPFPRRPRPVEHGWIVEKKKEPTDA